MSFFSRLLCSASLVVALAGATLGQDTITDPANAGKDFAVQGEYTGELKLDDGAAKFGVQIIALGDGNFQAVGYHGGLPGDGYNGEEPVKSEGRWTDRGVLFESDKGNGLVKDGTLTIMAGDKVVGTFKKINRESKTLGKKPPEGAVVLFDGSSTEGWKGGKLTDDGHLAQGTTSEKTFGDHKLHIEFRTPYKPKARGQGRGNSGVYVQGRYEIQVLDSFGLEGKTNECGGIYSVKGCDVNMCYPPLAWQTYDIDFTAAKYDDSGKVIAAPRMTVRHNGVVIHDDVELPADRNTTAAPVGPGPEKGPVYLQNHGNPVAYRNIWVVEK